MTLNPSKIVYDGGLRPKDLDIHGSAKIENKVIRITLKGNLDHPDLKLTSNPPLPQNQLLLMLATGKSWSITEASLSEGKFNPAVIKDFLDYFVFSGSGNNLAKTFGISEVSFKYDAQAKGIGVKKDLSKKVDVGYAVEQSKENLQAPLKMTQTLEGEYKVTNSFSLGVERRFVQNRLVNEPSSNGQTDDRVLLKYKKNF